MKNKFDYMRTGFLIISIVTLLVCLIAWASISKIESVARARGNIIAAQRTQVIQASTDGVISQIKISEGQHVKKGDVLVNMEQEQAQAALQDLEGKVAALRTSLARLQAEVYGRPLDFPASTHKYDVFIANQTELYNRRKKGLSSEIKALTKSKNLVSRERELASRLLKTGDIGQADVLRLERQQVDLEGQITAKQNKFFQDAQAELTKVDEELSTQEQVLADREINFSRTRIISPVDGIVSKIEINTAGARVRPGDVIMNILPTSSKLIVEVKMSPSDIGNIRVNLPASVKLDAYDYTIYGTLPGKVIYISPDALVDKTSKGDEFYYRVHISIDYVFLLEHNKENPEHKIDLQPGMTSTVEVFTGERTILKYLAKPLIKTFSESLGEQ
ncbi:HlyD family efflux transporter periplasmic adaptor subunit [Citrobacter portucalensis]|uniref:HlyD family efflux transporter periplasmic adaptor subunit n=1 Tax=Citrobacter portucalensis TaxID=1639133 RepID=A0AAW5WBR8_9ENTR|nr:HlyD family efflux transporter periplasmic adaptor subunit [Citrobacter portucalensis]MCX9004616.1 HlyD family efflux transporter periplasmic adaptor subunit [Citrobacter portucalensis]